MSKKVPPEFTPHNSTHAHWDSIETLQNVCARADFSVTSAWLVSTWKGLFIPIDDWNGLATSHRNMATLRVPRRDQIRGISARSRFGNRRQAGDASPTSQSIQEKLVAVKSLLQKETRDVAHITQQIGIINDSNYR